MALVNRDAPAWAGARTAPAGGRQARPDLTRIKSGKKVRHFVQSEQPASFAPPLTRKSTKPYSYPQYVRQSVCTDVIPQVYAKQTTR